MSIDAFFFDDETMHKINTDKSSFNIIIQIPLILYSSLVSSCTNVILRNLSLSEMELISLKKENNKKKIQKVAKMTKSYLILKFCIFFFLSYILLFFFWYFISCFCAVYINTQMILIKDSLISFSISMIYPFGLCLLPGIFRIISLRSKKKDKKILYIISGVLALI